MDTKGWTPLRPRLSSEAAMRTKLLYVTALTIAGAALAWVALRSPEPDYQAPTSAEIAAHVPAPTVIAGEIPAGSLVRTFDVEGMCCGGCTGKLYQSLRAVPGVSQAAVRFQDGVAEVVVPQELDPALLAEALTFDKYSASLRP